MFKIEKHTHFPQKIYRHSKTNYLSKTNIFLSYFEGTERRKDQIFRTLVDFNRNQTQITHWQNQLNFGIYHALLEYGNNTRNLFLNYKKSNEEWNAYVKDSRNDEIEAEYNLKWNNNPYFNFSSYIKEDMKSFLQVTLLYFHS